MLIKLKLWPCHFFLDFSFFFYFPLNSWFCFCSFISYVIGFSDSFPAVIDLFFNPIIFSLSPTFIQCFGGMLKFVLKLFYLKWTHECVRTKREICEIHENWWNYTTQEARISGLSIQDLWNQHLEKWQQAKKKQCRSRKTKATLS